jgi:probable F420-dependent oxidoreductase
MRIGIVLPQGSSDGPDARAWTRIRDIARHAEAVGLDSLWAYDHFVFRMPDEQGVIEEDGIHEAWTILTAVAASTERIGLGTIVLGTGFRPPALTAKMAATLDEVAGGRLTLGLGTGWHEPEYRAFGYPFDHLASRFDESLRIIVPLLHGERVTFHGAYHHVDDAVLIPPPRRLASTGSGGALPILVAAKGERVLRLTARWADAWNTAWFGLPDERFAGRLADLRAACEAEQRDPATLEVTVGVTVDVTAETAPAEGQPALPGRDHDAVASAFDRWRDEGAGHLQVNLTSVDERAIDDLAAARRLHLGEG